jgi:hypothetical protein
MQQGYMMTLLEQTNLIRASNPGLSFDTAWNQACSLQKVTGTFGRDSIDKGAKVIAVATDASLTHKPPNKKDGRHPAIIEELSKHWQLEQQKKQQGELAYADRLKAIHKLMTERNMSFDEAFIQTMQGEPLSDPGKAPAKAAQTAAKGQGELMLIQGAHAGFTFDIRTGKRAA